MSKLLFRDYYSDHDYFHRITPDGRFIESDIYDGDNRVGVARTAILRLDRSDLYTREHRTMHRIDKEKALQRLQVSSAEDPKISSRVGARDIRSPGGVR